MHEFGHAIGFYHEHQNPYFLMPYDEEKVFEFFKKNENWTESKTRQNFLKRSPLNEKIV